MTYAELHENPVGLNRLRIALLALLPKDGTPKTVAELAAATFVDPRDVTDALFDDFLDGHLEFDVRADTFAAKKHDLTPSQMEQQSELAVRLKNMDLRTEHLPTTSKGGLHG